MRHAAAALAAAAVLAAVPAHSQEQADANRTAISVVGGLSVGSSRPFGFNGNRFGGFGGSDAGFAVGGGIAHDLTPRLTLEATGLYLDRGASAWSADVGLRVNLKPSKESMVPYFAVSGGLYGESFESVDADGNRALDDLRGGRGFLPGRGQGGVPGIRDIGRDLGVTVSHQSSTDGMLTLGGGIRFAAGPHVFVRPDARAQVVFGGDNRVLGLFTLNFGYRF